MNSYRTGQPGATAANRPTYDDLVATVGNVSVSCDVGATVVEQQLRCALIEERLMQRVLRARIELLQAKLRKVEADAEAREGFVWRDVRVEGDEQLAA